MRFTLLALSLCALSASALAERPARRPIGKIRAGIASRVREEAAKDPDPVSRLHAHPAVQLLGWLESSRVIVPRAGYGDQHAHSPLQRDIVFNQKGQLTLRGEHALSHNLLLASRLDTIEGIDAVMGERLRARARGFDPSVRTMAEAMAVLDKAAQEHGAEFKRMIQDDRSLLYDSVTHGVAGVDATLLVAMHRALSGPKAVAPIASHGGSQLVLRAFDPNNYVWLDGRATTFPRLELHGRKILHESELAPFGIKTQLHLDRAIDAAMRDVPGDEFGLDEL